MNQAIPFLSVVIPCLNERDRLPLLLADLHQGRGDLELVIADGGSIDGSVEGLYASLCTCIDSLCTDKRTANERCSRCRG